MKELSTVEFMSYLRTLNIKLSVDGDKLRYSAPTGVMNPALQNELAERKNEILIFISEARLATRPQRLPIKGIPRDGELTLSFAQTRLWMLNQLEGSGLAYNIPSLFRFKGDFDLKAFEQSLSEIVRRHEVLRTYFLSEDGRPVQKIAPPEPFKISVFDLQDLPESTREKKVAQLAVADATEPFDLGKAPLMRATLLKLAPEEQVILFNMYHIAFDGWSFGVFMRELSVLYKAFVNGEESPLPELPIQYVDFAAWQRQWLQGEVLQGQLDYWRERLSGKLPVLELPTDRPRPAVQTYKGKNVSLVFSEELTDALKSLSQREDVTLFVTLLAAFKILLFRYSGQEDILVGTPIANRNQVEIEGLIGFFVNTLVMRTDSSGNPTFRELVRRVQDMALGAYENQDLPFEKLVEELHPERDVSRSPIFQVLFSLLNTPMKPLELPGLESSRLEFHNGGAQFDLNLYLEETDQGLTGLFCYNTDLFDEMTIVRMVGHYKTLLEGIVSDPDRRVNELPMLTYREREQALVEWNDTRREYPADQTLVTLFEKQVEQTPDAVAVFFDGQQLTYAELNKRANQLAHHLQKIGVGPDTLVGVCMERSLELVVALYGVLKAGGAYVPIDPEYPQERVAFMLQDAAVPVLLTQTRLVSSLPSHNSRVICLDGDWERIAREDPNKPAEGINPDNLAYMIYTSGSTGRPKGAMNTHRGICNRLLWMQDQYRLTEGDRVLQKTPFSFDVSVWEFFWPLLVGACLVVAKPGGHRDSAYLVNLIKEQQITVLHFVPPMLRMFLEDPGVEGCRSLRHVICSGEALPFDLQEQFFRLLPSQLHNLYGPTEAAVDVTHWTCQRDSELKIVPIGRPVANTQVYILDRHLQPVPVGVPGELHIGGVQVGRGYHNRPELTAERFIPDPFGGDPDARLYKTGDMCHWLSDGNIEYLGRMDFQVKIRGFRIELGEIEAVLGGHPLVKRCVVIVREDVPGDKRLVAYVVMHTAKAFSADELRSHLRERLPDFMVPSVYVSLDEIPMVPNGKVDRRALPAPERDLSSMLSDTYSAPDSGAEQKIAEIWQDILEVTKVGRDNNFFDLGGCGPER